MRRAALIWLWLIAIAAILVAFILLTPPLRFAVIDLQPLVYAAVFVTACVGYGLLARATDLPTAAALGAGIIGAATFFIALVHAIHPLVFVVLLIAGGQAILPVLRKIKTDKIVCPPLIIFAVVIAIIVPFVVAPDVSTDALEYHLLVPKLTIEQNAIRYQPLFVESNYPSLAEYDFIPMLVLSDARTAKCFHFLCALLLCLAIARLTPTNGAVAAAIFFSMPVAALTSGWARNDMLFTLFVVLSISHLLERHFVLAGVLFGFASWTKYTFVLVGIGIAVILIRERWRDWLRFAIPALLIAAVWMTKNAVLTGNPLYPFVNGIFHSPFWTSALDHHFRETLTRFEIPEWHWWTYIAFPFLLTVTPRVIDVQTGVLPLLLLPLLFVRGDRRLKSYVIAIAIAWLLIRTETRSLFSLFAVLSAIYAAAIDRLRGWRIILGLAVALNVIIMLVSTNVVTDPIRYFVGLESREDYIVRMDGKQAAYRWLDQHGEVRRVLLVGLHDPYYLAKPSVFSSCCDTPVAQAVDVNALKAGGFTHIAFRPSEYQHDLAAGLYTWSAAQRQQFEDFLRSRCRQVARVNGVIIFELM